ncbi:MAG: hypothetical protein ACI9UQ_000798 [Candidatus Krumholzibacteriia bacterium]|jgi:hypothetical protein
MKIFITAFALILCPVFCSASDSSVPRTMNSDGPSMGVESMELTELWRVGGEDSDLIFGRIADVLRHPDGHIYVLDNQLCEVTVISPDGEFVRTLSRKGDGPGELRQPTSLAFLSDDVLAIGMGFPGKIVSLNLDGTPRPSIYPIGEPAEGKIGVMMSSKFRDGYLVSSGGRVVFGDQHVKSHTDRFLTVGTGDLTEFHRILEATTPVDPSGQHYTEADNYYIDAQWALGASGKIYAPMTRDTYEVSVFNVAGNLLRTFGRQYNQRIRTQDEKDDVGPIINVNGGPPTNDWNIEDKDACIARIQYNDDDDTVWVLTPHGDNETGSILETWDVFSTDGQYLKQVQILLGDEIEDGDAHLMGGNVMVVVRGTGSSQTADSGDGAEEEDETEVEPLEIICYRVGQTSGIASK